MTELAKETAKACDGRIGRIVDKSQYQPALPDSKGNENAVLFVCSSFGNFV